MLGAIPRVVSVACVLAALPAAAADTGKVPITTTSAEARDLYIKGRDLTERLKATDGRKFFQQALEKDKDFALGYLGLSTTAASPREFFDSASKGAALAAKVSPGERDLLLANEAAAKGDFPTQEQHLTALVKAFPNDERAQTLLGTYYFVRQNYTKSIEH